MDGPPPDGPFASVLARGRGPHGGGRLVAVRREPARAAALAPLPDDLHPAVLAALRRSGIEALWSHQAEALRLARAGAHVGVVTGTASGKTLAYALPVLDRLVRDPHARALYLAPTKALAQDQGRRLAALGLGTLLRPALYDGDTDRPERGRARREANLLLTNPDMVHASVLGRNERWADVLANLEAVVVDEAHVYRGVFGAHVANVLRRLRRLCAIHGAAPQLLLASATVGNPEEALSALVGAPVAVVRADGAAAPARTLAIWNPEVVDPDTGERRSAMAEAADLVATLVRDGRRTIAFARSRRGVEALAMDVARRLGPELGPRVAPYRAGYTAEQRRDLERRLVAGDLAAVVATSALELGVDVGLLDACVVVGYPGSVASLRQRFGRAGRAGEGLGVIVCDADPLDQVLARDPERLLGAPVEAVVVDHASPEIHRAHLACAAAEAPLAPRDEALLGPGVAEVVDGLIAAGDAVRTPRGAAWARPELPHAAVSLRSASPDAVQVVDVATGQLLGTVDAERAPRTVHAGAVYLHLGVAYLVRALDLDARIAAVEEFAGDWTTEPLVDAILDLGPAEEARSLPAATATVRSALVRERVLGYRRRRLRDGQVLGQYRLDLPERAFPTVALAVALDPDAPWDGLEALHAAEHAVAAVVPLHALCDRDDVVGQSTALHADLGTAAIVVYDAHVGGIGLVRRAFRDVGGLVADAHALVAACPCRDGCPSCVQSTRCERGNEGLDKAGAAALLARLAGGGAPAGGC